MHPIIAKIGPVTIYSYGLMVAIGYFIALLLARQKARTLAIDPDRITDLTLVMVIAGFAGARILYILLNLSWYLSHPIEILKIYHGGLVFYGGLPLAAVSLAVFIRRKQLPSGKILDLLAPSIVIAHAFGRIGCFLNGCCYGKPAAGPVGIFVNGHGYIHPTQLYASSMLLVLFIILTCMYYRSHRSGMIFVLYVFLYGVGRFIIEFFRGDNPVLALGLTMSQFVSIVLMAGAMGYYMWRRSCDANI